MKSDTSNEDGIVPKIDDTEMNSILGKALASIDNLRVNNYEEEPVKENLEEPETEEVDDTVEQEDQEEPEAENDEVEPESQPEKEYKKEKREKTIDKEKYRKLQSEKHRALAEKAAADERIRELENMLTESLSAGTYHYGKNAYAELDRAREAKKRALNEGDIEALEAADDAIFNAKLTIKELERWANESAKSSPKPAPSFNQYQAAAQYLSQPQYDQNNTFQQEMIKEWLQDHPYINPDSKRYDPNMVLKVTRFAKKLDADGIYEPFSPQYMDELDDYIESVRTKRSTPASSIPKVGVVRNSYGGTKSLTTQKNNHLSSDELEIVNLVRHLGVTEDSYKKYKPKG